MDSQNQAVGIY